MKKIDGLYLSAAEVAEVPNSEKEKMNTAFSGTNSASERLRTTVDPALLARVHDAFYDEVRKAKPGEVETRRGTCQTPGDGITIG